MEEVLQKLLLVMFLIPFLFYGCVATSKTTKTDKLTESNKRINFPKENFSIVKPPDDWVMTKSEQTGEARWQNISTGSVIMVGKFKGPPHKRDFSYSSLAEEYINHTKLIYDNNSERCEANNPSEQEIAINEYNFYEATALIKCINFRVPTLNLITKELSMKIIFVFLKNDDMPYVHFVMNGYPEPNREKEIFYDLLRSFTLNKNNQTHINN